MAKLGAAKVPLLKRLKIAQSLWKSLKEFFSTTAVHCYHYLADSDRPWQERLMWWMVHIMSASGAIYIVMNSWNRFTDNPTITTLESTQYSIYNLPFPAVALCPNNKISRKAAENYADVLFEKKGLPAQYKDKEKLLKNIRFLGRLYDHDISDSEEFLAFQDMLENVDYNVTTGMFDMRAKLTELAPKCSDLLVKCRWGGKEVNCAQVFDFRRASEGVCCIFNFVRPADTKTAPKKPKNPVGIESFYGLTILLNLTKVDYFYPLRNFVGVLGLIFNPSTFADSSIGAVKEVVIPPGEEMFIGINMQTMKAEEDIQRYTVTKRGCLFSHELFEEFNGNYNFGDCLVKCKLRSIVALCRCIPFNLPLNFPDVDLSGVVVCTLSHVPCLNKYRYKWRTYRPRELVKGLEREMEDSLECYSCWPVCSTSIYNTEVVSSKMTFKFRNIKSILHGTPPNNDLTVIRVYFPMADSTLYKIDVLYTWYDILSEYGGILGLCLGCSVISGIELLYYLTIQFYKNLFSNRLNFMRKFLHQRPNVFRTEKFSMRQRIEYLH